MDSQDNENARFGKSDSMIEAGNLFRKVDAKGAKVTKDSGICTKSTSQSQAAESTGLLSNPQLPDTAGINMDCEPPHALITRATNLGPTAHLPQPHPGIEPQPPDPSMHSAQSRPPDPHTGGGTSNSENGLQETGNAKFSRSEMIIENSISVRSHTIAREVEQNEEYDQTPRQATAYDPRKSKLVPGTTWPFWSACNTADELVGGRFHHITLVEWPNGVFL
jgi:hypothetical protein